MKRSYVIVDVNGEYFTGHGWDDFLDKAARWSTLLGASEVLCQIAATTDRKRYPLGISRRRKARKPREEGRG